MRRLHILQVYKDYFPVLGGMENHLRILSEGLVARGHQVTALVSNTERGTVIEQRNGVTVIKASQWLRRASTPISPAMLTRSWRVPADLIHLHHPFPPGDVLYWLRWPHLPLVITYQSDIVRQKRLLQVYHPLLMRTLGAARKILVHSPQYVETSAYLRANRERCQIVPLSVDSERFRAPDAQAVAALRARFGAQVVLFVGRFRYYKGLHFLLEALTQVSDASLVLVGVGPEEQNLRRLADQLGLAERIFWAGEVADAALPAYVAAADVFVLPAHLRAEAFGIVQLEAAAAGVPLLSTELGTGTSFVNQHGVTGFVVPPANPAALARALQVLLANPALRARFGANGRQRAQTLFSASAMLDAVEHAYAEALSMEPSNTL